MRQGPDRPGPDRSRTAPIAVLGLIAVMMVFIATYVAGAILLPILLALYLATILAPAVSMLGRLYVPTSLAAGMVTLLFVSTCLGATLYFFTPFQNWVERGAYVPYQARLKIEELRASATAAADKVEEITEIGSEEDDTSEDSEGRRERVNVAVQDIGEYLFGTVTTATANFVALSVLLFFFLAYGRRMVVNFTDGCRDPFFRRSAQAFALDIHERLAAYFRVIAVVNVALGLVAAGALALLDFPNPAFWGAVVGAMNFLPFVGPAFSILAVALVSLLTFDAWFAIVLPPLTILLLNGIEAQFVTPTFVGKRLRLNPLAVIISIIVGAWMWGLLGAILAVPLLATIDMALLHFGIANPLHKALQ